MWFLGNYDPLKATTKNEKFNFYNQTVTLFTPFIFVSESTSSPPGFPSVIIVSCGFSVRKGSSETACLIVIPCSATAVATAPRSP